MNNTSTAVSNAALSHLGVSTTILDFDTDKSKEAQACRAFFDQIRVEALRDFAWPFASKIVALELVAQQPNIEWLYAYRIPADRVRLLRILNGMSRMETRDTSIPYKISSDSTGGLIFTDQPDAQLEYICNLTDLTQFPADVLGTIAFMLAFVIGPRVMTTDKSGFRRAAFDAYRIRLSDSRQNAANEERLDPPQESEFITTRG